MSKILPTIQVFDPPHNKGSGTSVTSPAGPITRLAFEDGDPLRQQPPADSNVEGQIEPPRSKVFFCLRPEANEFCTAASTMSSPTQLSPRPSVPQEPGRPAITQGVVNQGRRDSATALDPLTPVRLAPFLSSAAATVVTYILSSEQLTIMFFLIAYTEATEHSRRPQAHRNGG